MFTLFIVVLQGVSENLIPVMVCSFLAIFNTKFQNKKKISVKNIFSSNMLFVSSKNVLLQKMPQLD